TAPRRPSVGVILISLGSPRGGQPRSRGVLGDHRFKPARIALAVALLALLTLGAAPAGADSMRCGKWVVSESVTVDELVNKCGQPRSKEITKDDVYMTSV